MYLARAVEYSVQTGRAPRIPFEWLFPLTGFRASESGINCRILNIVTVNAALLLVVTRPATTVPGVQITRVLGHIVATSKPVVFSRAKVGHECRECCHRFRLFLYKVPGKPLVTDIVLCEDSRYVVYQLLSITSATSGSPGTLARKSQNLWQHSRHS